MASPASRPRSLANVNGLTRNSAASSPVRMSVSNRDTTRGLQDRAASSRASRSSSVRSSTTVVIGLPLDAMAIQLCRKAGRSKMPPLKR